MKKIINVRWLTGLLMVTICCAIYATLMSFRTMSLSEGWYTEYAWQINNGNMPYRDFEYLFFPLYLHIIAFFTRFFGYSIFALRVLGVIVFASIGAALYCVFAKVFDNFSATVAAITATMFVQSEVAQVFYDYIRFHDLFAVITMYFLVNVTQSCMKTQSLENSRFSSFFEQICVPIVILATGISGVLHYPFSQSHKIFGACLVLIIVASCKLIWNVAVLCSHKRSKAAKCVGNISAHLCGIFVSAECMIKQSNGTIMIAFLLIYIICCGIFLKRKSFFSALRGVVSGIIFSFSLLSLYLLQMQSLKQFVQCCFKSALAAKGGIITALFQWIPSNITLYFPKIYVTVFVVLALYFSIAASLRLLSGLK